MNQTTKKDSSPIKKIAISVLLSFALFFLVLLILAFSLSKLSRFEIYFPFAPWIAGIFVSLLNAIFFRSAGKEAPLFAGFAALLFFSISIGIGLLLKAPFSWIDVLPRAAILTLLSPLLVFLFSRTKSKKKKGGKFRFLK